MRHAVVVPYTRPEARARLEALIASNRDVQFVIVENRGARGTFSRATSAVILTSEDSAGAARNAGLDWVTAQGFSFVSFLDDDDYYGPAYLAEAREALDSYDVVQKGIGFVRLPDGLYLFNSQQHYRIMLGNSISARVATCPRFGAVSCGEEVAFTQEARIRGLREAVLPPFGFVYDRSRPVHVYPCSPVQFLRAHAPAAFLGDLPDSVVDAVTPPSDDEIFRDLESRFATKAADITYTGVAP